MKSRQRDWELLYERHHNRVLTTKSRVDHHPPTLHAANAARLYKIKEDSNAHKYIFDANMDLLVTMNGIARTGGKISTFAESYAPRPQNRKIVSVNAKIAELELKNLRFAKQLETTKPSFSTRLVLPVRPKKGYKRKKEPEPVFVPPVDILKKYSNLKLPEDSTMVLKLLRPKINMVLEVKNVRPLGTLVIQLYTEACPQVVYEFVKACVMCEKERITFTRIFPSLWMEGEMTIKGPLASYRPIEYDMRSLQNDEGCVLSFPKSCLKGFYRGFINFSLSFKPLKVVNGKRVAFGIVKRGHKLLQSVQQYGTKNGKPVKEIVVTQMYLGK